jgi:hypothetical protein
MDAPDNPGRSRPQGLSLCMTNENPKGSSARAMAQAGSSGRACSAGLPPPGHTEPWLNHGSGSEIASLERRCTQADCTGGLQGRSAVCTQKS